MLLKACGNGHFYDGAKFLECPHCAGGLTRENFQDEEMNRKKQENWIKRSGEKVRDSIRRDGWYVPAGLSAVIHIPFMMGKILWGLGDRWIFPLFRMRWERKKGILR